MPPFIIVPLRTTVSNFPIAPHDHSQITSAHQLITRKTKETYEMKRFGLLGSVPGESSATRKLAQAICAAVGRGVLRFQGLQRNLRTCILVCLLPLLTSDQWV